MTSTVSLGFENKLWKMANKLRGNIESSEYKHVILGLVFLKYISDSFEERYADLKTNYEGMEEDRDAYLSENVFFVPKEARWDHIKSQAKLPTIGQVIDNAMVLIERENASLKGVLPKTYGRPELDKTKLGELIDLFSFNLGSEEAKGKDILGRVYEYFLKKFGTKEGEFYTPPSIVRLLVNMIEPYEGRVYDPCCGSGGMFVQSAKFVEEHRGKIGDISIYGQEFTATTWRLAKMNLAIRGIDGNLGERDADTFKNDQHRELQADYVLANPPFNINDWGQLHLLDDPRWRWGLPTKGNANYAWIQHIISKLSFRGIGAFLMSSNTLNSDYEIRKNIIEEGFVKTIISLPPNMFYSTPIAPVIWVVAKTGPSNSILFIDVSKEGEKDPEDKKNIIFSDSTIDKISSVFKRFFKDNDNKIEDNFSIIKEIEEVKNNSYNLNPRNYVQYQSVENFNDLSLNVLKAKIHENINNSYEIGLKLKALLGRIND